MADDNKPVYSKPASQEDLERRQENGNRSDRVLSTADAYVAPEPEGSGRDMRVEGNEVDEYIGVDPVYQNYASDTDKPLVAEEGAEATLVEEFTERLDPKPAPEDAKSEDEEDDDEPEEEQAGGSAGPESPAAFGGLPGQSPSS